MVDAVIECPKDVYTLLTAGDVATEISVSVVSEFGVELIATDDASQPAATVVGFPIPYYGNGWSQATIVAMFPGVADADRLWAKPLGSPAPSRVRISYA